MRNKELRLNKASYRFSTSVFNRPCSKSRIKLHDSLPLRPMELLFNCLSLMSRCWVLTT